VLHHFQQPERRAFAKSSRKEAREGDGSHEKSFTFERFV
jgi:hypothetical protein